MHDGLPSQLVLSRGMLLYSSPKKSPFSANQVGAVQVASRGSTIVVKSGQIGPTLVLLVWFCDRIGNGGPNDEKLEGPLIARREKRCPLTIYRNLLPDRRK